VGVLALSALAVIAVAYLALSALAPTGSWSATELRAAGLMRDGEARVRQGRAALGWKADPDADPNGTGMIGVEYGSYTTSLGNIEAKRTATDPRMAALVARLFSEVGAKPGDVVAIGASGSFPALTLVTLAAAKALGLHAVVIASMGASTWGGNVEGFTAVDLLDWLRDSPVAGFEVAGVSLGGDDDSAGELEPAVREAARLRIAASRYRLIEAATLRDSVLARLALYDAAADGRRIACYVNIGGNLANMGSGADVLDIRPGLATVPTSRVPAENRGVLHEMSIRGVPTLHLLNLYGLTTRYGLPWDPSPLFDPDASRPEGWGPSAEAASAVYLSLFALVSAWALLARRKRPGPKGRRPTRRSGESVL
jgi:poly-gamma-glutamate system protein